MKSLAPTLALCALALAILVAVSTWDGAAETRAQNVPAPPPWPPGTAPALEPPLPAPPPALEAPPSPRPVLAPAPAPTSPPFAASPGLLAAPPLNLDEDPRPFQEAHWQGLEAIPLTPALARTLGIPEGARGVVLDDVSLPADLEGFEAGDLVTDVGAMPTPDLNAFIDAADRARERRQVEVQVQRRGEPLTLALVSRTDRLGTANGETAPMIQPGWRAPHGYQGPCTNCHAIGTSGQLPLDPGDLFGGEAPRIRAGQAAPHRDRGRCSACHTVIP